MDGVYRAVKVSEHVYWVGAIDWNIRDFHGYTTPRGSTYNAYLILADKVTLIDTVKAPFIEEMFSRISSVIDPKDISYIVSNHSEMDHTGALPGTIDRIGPEKVFASTMGASTIREHFQLDQEIIPVKDGATISLGNMDLSFIETRMLHWPDSMFSYLKEDRLLFSQDAFGMHLASSQRFDDNLDVSLLEYEAATYYANIILPYSPLVLKLLNRVKGMNLDIDIIAPDHGPIWRKNIAMILDLYSRWASQKPTGKAVIIYATMWHSTEVMAEAIAEGLWSKGISARLMDVTKSHRSDVIYEVLDAGALIVGSPTLNNNMFQALADVLTYLKGLRPRNLVGAAFGSYGWSGDALGQVNDILRSMKVELVGEGINIKYVPDADALNRCFSLGTIIAERLGKEVG